MYINADELQRERGRTSEEAQQLATQMRAVALESRNDVLYETVMSHPSNIAELQRAKVIGYHITVHLVGTESPDINEDRIRARVQAGGHDVPRERIRPRYERMLAFAPIAIAYADQALVFDNTEPGGTGRGLTVHAALQGTRMIYNVGSPANWVQRLTALVNERAAEIEAFSRGAGSRGLPPQLARLDDGVTQGPIVAVGKHYSLQFDDASRVGVLHDRVLWGRMPTRCRHSRQSESCIAAASRRSILHSGQRRAERLQVTMLPAW